MENEHFKSYDSEMENEHFKPQDISINSESWWSKHLYGADCTFVSSSVLHSLADPLSIDIVDRLLPS
jgi:hypothetical protein